MGYFPVDDILLSHWRAKVAGAAGVGLWTMGGIYCNTQLTDGHIPKVVAENLLPNAKPAVKKVLESGLWESCTEHEHCYVMRAYHADSSGGQRQPTRAEVERRRAVARDKKREQRRGTAGRYAPPAEPVPPRPDDVPEGHKGDTQDVPPSNSILHSTPLQEPLLSEEVGAQDAPATNAPAKTRRATTLPRSWEPNAGHRQYAATNHLALDVEVEKFRDHHAHKGTLGKDWDAGFRTWLRNSRTWRDEQQAKTTPKADPNDWMNR